MTLTYFMKGSFHCVRLVSNLISLYSVDYGKWTVPCVFALFSTQVTESRKSIKILDDWI